MLKWIYDLSKNDILVGLFRSFILLLLGYFIAISVASFLYSGSIQKLLIVFLLFGGMVLFLVFKSFDVAIILIIYLSILFPDINIFSGLPGVRLDEIVIFLSAIVFLIKYFMGDKVRIHRIKINYLFAAFFLSLLFSIMYSYSFLAVPFSARDLYEAIKIIKYFLLFNLVAQINVSDKKINFFLITFVIAAVLSACIGIFQNWNILSMNALSHLYNPNLLGQIGEGANLGVTSTFGNPNAFAETLVIAAILVACVFVWGHWNKLLMAGIFLWLSYGILLSQSRTALLTLLIVLLLMMFVKIRENAKKMSMVVFLPIIILFVLLVCVLFVYLPGVTLYRHFSLTKTGIMGDTSFIGRVFIWIDQWQYFVVSPIFGHGPSKALISTTFDNQYLVLLVYQGLIGLFLFLSLLASLYFNGRKLVQKGLKEFGYFEQYIIIAIIIGGLFANFLNNSQISSYFWVLMGLLFKLLLNRQVKNEPQSWGDESLNVSKNREIGGLYDS